MVRLERGQTHREVLESEVVNWNSVILGQLPGEVVRLGGVPGEDLRLAQHPLVVAVVE